MQHLCHHAKIVSRGHLVESWPFGTLFLTVIQMEASKMYSAMLTLGTAGVWAIMDWRSPKHKASKCPTVPHLVSSCLTKCWTSWLHLVAAPLQEADEEENRLISADGQPNDVLKLKKKLYRVGNFEFLLTNLHADIGFKSLTKFTKRSS